MEEGTGEAVLNDVRTVIGAGFAVLVPTGTNHNIINTGSVPLKLYTIYAPPNHRDGVIQLDSSPERLQCLDSFAFADEPHGPGNEFQNHRQVSMSATNADLIDVNPPEPFEMAGRTACGGEPSESV